MDEAASLARDGTLTRREKLLIVLLAQGLNRKQIAVRLRAGEEAVKRDFRRIFTKLRVADPLELMFYAVDHRLVGGVNDRKNPRGALVRSTPRG